MRQTARAIIIRDGLLLVIARQRFDRVLGMLHYFSIPGGGVEAGESPEEAVLRELYEEILVEASIERYLGAVILPPWDYGEARYDERKHNFYLCQTQTLSPRVNPHAPEVTARHKHDYRFENMWVPLSTPAEKFHPDYPEAVRWLQAHQADLSHAEPFELIREVAYNDKKGE